MDQPGAAALLAALFSTSFTAAILTKAPLAISDSAFRLRRRRGARSHRGRVLRYDVGVVLSHSGPVHPGHGAEIRRPLRRPARLPRPAAAGLHSPERWSGWPEPPPCPGALFPGGQLGVHRPQHGWKASCSLQLAWNTLQYGPEHRLEEHPPELGGRNRGVKELSVSSASLPSHSRGHRRPGDGDACPKLGTRFTNSAGWRNAAMQATFDGNAGSKPAAGRNGPGHSLVDTSKQSAPGCAHAVGVRITNRSTRLTSALTRLYPGLICT